MNRHIVLGMLLGIACLLLSGCGDGHLAYTIHPDGSVHEEHELQLDDYFAQKVPSWKQDLSEQEKDWEDKGYTVDRQKNGATVKKDCLNLQEIVIHGGKNNIWSPDERYGGVRYRKGFFYDTYTLELPWEANKGMQDRSFLNERPQTFEDAALQQLFKQGMQKDTLDFTLRLPYAADFSNATTTQADGRELIWDIKPAMLGDKDVTVNVGFRIYHKNVLAASAVVGGIFAIYAIVALAMAALRGSTSPLGRLALPSGSIALVAVCVFGGVVAYQMKHPPQLTNADRIYNDTARDSEGRPLADGLKRLEQARPNPLDEIEKILKDHGFEDTVLAASESDETGFLALLRGDVNKGGGYYYVVYDAKDQQTAQLYDHMQGKGIQTFRSYDVLKNGKIDYHPLLFSMQIAGDPNRSGQNASSGAWKDGKHTLPIYVLYDVDEQDHLKNKRFTTGYGYYPSHYMTELKNPIYRNLADAVVEKASALKLDMLKRNIDLSQKNAGPEGKKS